MQIDFHLLKWVQSPNLNPEVDFQLYGGHLEKSIWRHNCRYSSDYLEIWQIDAKWHADHYTWVNMKPEVQFQYGDIPFPKPEVALAQPRIEIFHRNLVCKKISTTLSECSHQTWTRK